MLATDLPDSSATGLAATLGQIVPEGRCAYTGTKLGVVAAERELRKQLGRKPTEAERHGDLPFQRALKAFKEASQVLFVANSVANWDD